MPRVNKPLITIQNICSTTQSVYDTDGIFGTPGMRYDLGPYMIRAVHIDLGNLFLTRRAKFVVPFENKPVPAIPGEPVVWIANMTGNPFVPQTVQLTRTTKGNKEPYTITNPLSDPHLITRTMKGGTKVVPDPTGQGKTTVPVPGVRFEFAPFTRQPVSLSYANWLLERDQRQPAHCRHQLAKSKEPGNFVPNETWPLRQLQIYATLLGYAPLLQGRPDLLGGDEYDREQYQTELSVAEARCALAQALFFPLCDPKVELPDERDFAFELQRIKAEDEEREREFKKAERERKSKTKGEQGGDAAPAADGGV